MLIRVISRDGEIVQQPEIYINGKRAESFLIDFRADLKEISVRVGKFESFFPINNRLIESLKNPEKKFLQFSENEIKKAPTPAIAGAKTVFLLPDQFRAVPEFESEIYLFCLENNAPCKDKTVFINGSEFPMENGYTGFSSVFKMENSISISFSDGSSVSAQLPYIGKMFRFYRGPDTIAIASLTDVNNVHVDCYSKNRWIGTDILKITAEGLRLPPAYKKCETVQASFNSSSPGSTYISISESSSLLGDVTDSYYSSLAHKIDKFSPIAINSFIKSYNSSFFRILPVIFSGQTLETQFNKEKEKKLNTIWWLILIFSSAGLALFIHSTAKNLKSVEGVDGELISYSLMKQKLLLAIVFIFYIIFFASLLYLLKNLA